MEESRSSSFTGDDYDAQSILNPGAWPKQGYNEGGQSLIFVPLCGPGCGAALKTGSDLKRACSQRRGGGRKVLDGEGLGWGEGRTEGADWERRAVRSETVWG
jgi:hypothetical protein